MEEQAVGEDAIRAEEDLIRRRREKARQDQANNGKNKIFAKRKLTFLTAIDLATLVSFLYFQNMQRAQLG